MRLFSSTPAAHASRAWTTALPEVLAAELLLMNWAAAISAVGEESSSSAADWRMATACLSCCSGLPR